MRLGEQRAEGVAGGHLFVAPGEQQQPVPAREPVLPGEPLPPETTKLILPGGMTMPVFDPIKARRKALDSPRLKAAYIAAKTTRF